MSSNRKDGQTYQDIITALRKEAFKEYRVYDVQLREIERYQAPRNARHGEACLYTRKVYDANSNRVVYVEEDVTAWDSSWEQ